MVLLLPIVTTTTAAAVASSQNVISPTDASDGDSFGGAVALSADGKTLAVGDVLLFSEGMEAPVAHASMTYAIPPAIRPVI